jgi:hypothetical protein
MRRHAARVRTISLDGPDGRRHRADTGVAVPGRPPSTNPDGTDASRYILYDPLEGRRTHVRTMQPNGSGESKMHRNMKLVAAAKRLARRMASAKGTAYQKCLDAVAVENGRRHWADFVADPVAVDAQSAWIGHEPDFTAIPSEAHFDAVLEYGRVIGATAFWASSLDPHTRTSTLMYTRPGNGFYDHSIDATGLDVDAMEAECSRSARSSGARWGTELDRTSVGVDGTERRVRADAWRSMMWLTTDGCRRSHDYQTVFCTMDGSEPQFVIYDPKPSLEEMGMARSIPNESMDAIIDEDDSLTGATKPVLGTQPAGTGKVTIRKVGLDEPHGRHASLEHEGSRPTFWLVRT